MSHSSRYALEGVGTQRATSDFAGRGNCSTSGLHLSLFSLHPFPLLLLLTIFPSFGDWLMWHARFSLGHSLWYKSWLDTWKRLLVRLQLSWSTKRITARGSDPKRENMTSVYTAACHLFYHFVSFCQDKTDTIMERKASESQFQKVTEVNKGFYLECIPYRKQIRLCLNEM